MERGEFAKIYVVGGLSDSCLAPCAYAASYVAPAGKYTYHVLAPSGPIGGPVERIYVRMSHTGD